MSFRNSGPAISVISRLIFTRSDSTLAISPVLQVYHTGRKAKWKTPTRVSRVRTPWCYGLELGRVFGLPPWCYVLELGRVFGLRVMTKIVYAVRRRGLFLTSHDERVVILHTNSHVTAFQMDNTQDDWTKMYTMTQRTPVDIFTRYTLTKRFIK